MKRSIWYPLAIIAAGIAGYLSHPLLCRTKSTTKNNQAPAPAPSTPAHSSLLGTSVATIVPGTPLPPQTTHPEPLAQPSHNADFWLSRYKPTDLRQWSNAWHKNLHTSWFDGKSTEMAKNYIMPVGPLGIRVRMHDQTWSNFPAFVEIAPSILKDNQGQLFTNALEVVEVLPGSPADGSLEPGDLILEVDHQRLLSSQEVPTPEPYQFKDKRSLYLHLGQLIDTAEGKGETALTILRKPTAISPPDGSWNTLNETTFSHTKTPASSNTLKLPTGHDVRLVVTDGDNGNGSDGFDWKQVSLTNGTSTIPLHKAKITRYSVGWQSPRNDEATSSFWAHAPSEIQFSLPEGDWSLTYTPAPNENATVKAIIQSRPTPSIPESLSAQTKTITLPLTKIGSFASTMPAHCVKTANIIAQQAAWLVTNQQENGSWQRPAGYTSNHYDTAWAALGLMATDADLYRPQIQKAANYLSSLTDADGWAVPTSVVAIFLSEYWLHYHDDSVLPGLQRWINCLLNESLTGDFTIGHGHNPGYRGTGVSTGGSHASAALAVASKTPIEIDTRILDKMLQRVQEIAPDGHVPYGRGREHAEFTPAIKDSATYSGRHGPYLVASLIHGGPELFTKNCTDMFALGQKGGADQGHATETLSTQWAYIAMAASNLNAYHAHLRALQWKITLLRAFNGGFLQPATNLEYSGGESLLDGALRAGSWLVVLNAEKQNLAITGNPQYRTKSLMNLPPIQHQDAMFAGCYARDWGVVDAILGSNSPTSLKSTLAKIRDLQTSPKLASSLTELLQTQALTAAQDVQKITSLEPTLKCYLIEMLLGVDFRITATQDEKNPAEYELKVDQQFPLAGSDLTASQLLSAGLPCRGTIQISGSSLTTPIEWPITPDNGVQWNNWATKSLKTSLKSTEPLTAHFSYKIGTLNIDYTRPISIATGEEYGNGEKQRKVINDRRVWVPGTLTQNHTRWNLSFRLPSGQFIPAATQGNEILVHHKQSSWISPNHQSLIAGTQGEFLYTSGWQHFEARIPEIKISTEQPILPIQSIQHGNTPIPPDLIAGLPSSLPITANTPIEINLAQPSTVYAIDLRGKGCQWLTVEAFENNQWRVIHLGYLAQFLKQPIPVKTQKIRITCTSIQPKAEINVIRLYPLPMF